MRMVKEDPTHSTWSRMSFVKSRIEFPDRDLSAADAAVSTLAAADLHKRFRNCATVLRRADPNSDSVIQGERGSPRSIRLISVSVGGAFG